VVYGTLEHLDSQGPTTILIQSIATRVQQQIILQQFSGLFQMLIWVEVGILDSWTRTLLAPHISSCLADPHVDVLAIYQAVWVL
jgi:hypothetical protein